MEQIRDTVIDPVCGEELDPEETDYTMRYQGQIYYFCCINCQLDFEEAPEDYIALA